MKEMVCECLHNEIKWMQIYVCLLCKFRKKIQSKISTEYQTSERDKVDANIRMFTLQVQKKDSI